MRKRILSVAVIAAVLAIALFGVPLAYAVQKIFYYDERAELERIALRAALQASSTLPDAEAALRGPDRQEGDDVRLAIYGPDGRRLAGRGGDTADEAVRVALRGSVADRSIGHELVRAVPVFDGDRLLAVTRAASDRWVVQRKVFGTWGVMLGLAAVAGGCSSLLAAEQARRLARPLVRLEEVAEELGDGNFAVRAELCGVQEIDRAGAALNRTAERLDDILVRERTFTALASHQLRTPLTELRLGLENALTGPATGLHDAVVEALDGADRLSATIDDVLSLARGTRVAEPLAVQGALDAALLRWAAPLRAAGRDLVLVSQDPPAALAAPAAVRQILDILLDNALRHGRGTVTLIARSSSGAVAIDVIDEGHVTSPLVPDLSEPPVTPRRLGLALASSLAAAQSGRLVHARTDPTTRLTVLFPAAGPAD